MSFGYLGHLGIKEEAVFGYEGDDEFVYEELVSETIMMENSYLNNEVTDGLRSRKGALLGRVSAGGAIEMQLKPEGAIPWILKGLQGSVDSHIQSEGIYEHVFTPMQTQYLPSYSLLITQNQSSQLWLGCTFSGATLSIANDDYVGLGLRVISQRPMESSFLSPPFFRNISPCTANSVTFMLNGETNAKIEKFSMDIENNVLPIHTLNGRRYCRKHSAGKYAIEGRITLEYETESEMERLWGYPTASYPTETVAPGSLSFTIDNPYEISEGGCCRFTFDLPEIYYRSAQANITNAGDRILQTVSFFATYNRFAEKTMDIVLRNSESGYSIA